MRLLNKLILCLALSSAITFSTSIPLLVNAAYASTMTNKLSFVEDNQIDNETINIKPSQDDCIEVFNSTDKFIYLTKDDIYLMAQIVYAESKGEPYEGKVAVASVILNRVLAPHFPSTVREVVLQPNAFSCVVDGYISVVPTEECYSAVYDAINGNDPTGEAVFFYNPEIATCSWMINASKSESKSIGRHLFFK